MVERVTVAGFNATGSTCIYQICCHLLDKTKVGKTHGFAPDPTLHRIVTYRDLRDIACTRMARGPEAATDAEWEKAFTDLKSKASKWVEWLEYYRQDPLCLLIQYEEWLPDRVRDLVIVISKFLEQELDDERLDQITQHCSLDRAKEIASKFPSFANYDKKTYIHGRHVTSDGQGGRWRDWPDHISELAREYLQECNEAMGYQWDRRND